MRTLIIPDVHNKVDIVTKLMGTVKWDEMVCLGDWFDDIGDDMADAVWTSIILSQIAEVPHVHLLWGNHDLSYYSQFLRAPGWTEEKQSAIDDMVSEKTWAKFKMFHIVDTFIMSHAGIHESLLHPVYGFTPQWFGNQAALALPLAVGGVIHPMLRQGRSRGGAERYGGITWCDWSELTPLEGYTQVVGHTPSVGVRTKTGLLCMDTHLRHYAIIEDGKLTILEVPA